jgi:hypothetical protein
MSEDLSALDRELSELLAVEPSPAFAASVRARIEQQPAPTFAWRWWVGAALASAAAVTIAVAVSVLRTPTVQLAVVAHPDVYLPAPHPTVQPPVATVSLPHVAPARHAERHERAPEVLVDPALAAAVRRLTTEQRVLPERPPEPSLTPVVVEPLKVPDIADSASKQGDRQ